MKILEVGMEVWNICRILSVQTNVGEIDFLNSEFKVCIM